MNGLRINNYIALSKCPVCGKVYVPAPEHVYKVLIGGKRKNVCSWHCMRKYERKDIL